jgi:hypothetical protein
MIDSIRVVDTDLGVGARSEVLPPILTRGGKNTIVTVHPNASVGGGGMDFCGERPPPNFWVDHRNSVDRW